MVKVIIINCYYRISRVRFGNCSTYGTWVNLLFRAFCQIGPFVYLMRTILNNATRTSLCSITVKRATLKEQLLLYVSVIVSLSVCLCAWLCKLQRQLSWSKKCTRLSITKLGAGIKKRGCRCLVVCHTNISDKAFPPRQCLHKTICEYCKASQWAPGDSEQKLLSMRCGHNVVLSL